MGLAYVLDPCIQHQNRAGVNNVHGFFKVFLDNTDDAAVTYKDFAGTLNEERIDIDNNGRCVIIADAEHSYRVEMYAPNGDLLFTQYPVWPLSTGGGGMDAVSIESTDGSISIDKTSSGGVVSYDLSAHPEDDPEFLDWISCSWYDLVDGVYVPRYDSGTMSVGSRGVVLSAGMHYHVTASIRANKNGATPYYDNIGVHFSLFDGETTESVQDFTRIVDHSLGLSQDFQVEADVHVGSNDSQLVVTIDGAMEGTVLNLLSIDAHRIYSGVPKIPDGVARQDWVEQNYQGKLTAGQNITINSETDTISAVVPEQVQADWTEQDTGAPSFINNKPDLSVYAREADLSTVAFSGSYSDLSNKPDLSVYAQRDDLSTVAFSGNYGDVHYAPYIQTAEIPGSVPETYIYRIGPTGNGNNLPIYAERASHDPNGVEFTSGYALKSELPTIDQHYNASSTNAQSGVAVAEALSNVPSPLSAGGGIVINQNTISVKADGTSITYNSSGEIEAHNTLVASGGIHIDPTYNTISVKADGTSITYNSSGEIEAHNTLVAGGGIHIDPTYNTISVKADGTSITYNASGELQANVSGGVTDVTVDGSSVVNAQGVAEITMPTFTQVNSDWNASSGVAEILNKPANLVQDANYVHTDENFTSAEKTKLSGIAAGAEVNVQADWNESSSSSDAYIQNKPDLSIYAQSANLATVATTGSYSDLSGKPTIPAAQVNSDWNASSGVAEILNKPSLATVATTGAYSDLTGTPSLATVATTGAYSDLTGTPTIPAAQVQSDWNQSDNTQVDFIKNKPSLATVATTGAYSDLSGTPNLATVATSGSYSDLTNTPSIPTIGTITL